MHYAFDFGGVLEIDDKLVEMLNFLYYREIDVSIISAIGPDQSEWQVDRIRKRGINSKIPVHFVIMHEQAKPDGAYERQVGHMKADVMVKIRATILIDDNPYICQSVRERGLIALQYSRRNGI